MKLVYLELFSLVCSPDAFMADVHCRQGPIMKWEMAFLRVVQDWELEVFSSFFDMYSAPLARSDMDRMCWHPNWECGY